MFIQWSDAYILGIPAVDAEHKGLADLVNHFFAQAEQGAGSNDLGATLNQLIDDTRSHFRNEESLLDRSNYPLLAQHSTEHDRLLLQMSHFQQAYQEGQPTARELTIDTVEFFRHWLLSHIQREDAAYKPYVMKIS
ncbi:MAG TPA: bacteriohemerythrin [Candidatus Sulfotelmatobacter sp.]|jgi:hemerythrin-like metal-binding protein|nr:bacteriohemerythrin [Candidatus Sulfotelmatobacter sp.]